MDSSPEKDFIGFQLGNCDMNLVVTNSCANKFHIGAITLYFPTLRLRDMETLFTVVT